MALGFVLAIIEGQEWLILAVLGILLFGSARLPKLARSIGVAKREFERGISEGQADADDDPKDTDPAAAPTEGKTESD